MDLSAYANLGTAQDEAIGSTTATFPSVNSATDIVVTAGTTLNSGSLLVQGLPLGGFQKANAVATLTVTNPDRSRTICTNTLLIGEKTTSGVYASRNFNRVTDSFSLSCRGELGGVNQGDVLATLTVRAWAESYGLGDARAQLNITAGSFTLRRCCVGALDAPEGTVPLFSWYSPSRNDNFATSHPQWAGCQGSIRQPDYHFVRIEGFVFDPAQPQRPGTVPLYSWWSGDRGDNWTTSQHQVQGAAGGRVSPSYGFIRLEGFVNPHSPVRPPDTVPLYSWWSPAREDNWITSQHEALANAGEAPGPDYCCRRSEGLIFRPR